MPAADAVAAETDGAVGLLLETGVRLLHAVTNTLTKRAESVRYGDTFHMPPLRAIRMPSHLGNDTANA